MIVAFGVCVVRGCSFSGNHIVHCHSDGWCLFWFVLAYQRHTYGTLATHLPHTCGAPAAHLRHTCDIPATHLRRACDEPVAYLHARMVGFDRKCFAVCSLFYCGVVSVFGCTSASDCYNASGFFQLKFLVARSKHAAHVVSLAALCEYTSASCR